MLTHFNKMHQEIRQSRIQENCKESEQNTSLAAKGALAHRLQRHSLQNPKWPPGGPKMADGVLKGVYP